MASRFQLLFEGFVESFLYALLCRSIKMRKVFNAYINTMRLCHLLLPPLLTVIVEQGSPVPPRYLASSLKESKGLSSTVPVIEPQGQIPFALIVAYTRPRVYTANTDSCALASQ
jgi:hypothetical protein